MNWDKFRGSTSALMVIIIASKLIGMARDVVLANYFGTSAVSDAYLIAVSVPTLLFYFIGHAIATAYQPMYNRVKNKDGVQAANRYSNNLMCISFVIATVLVAALVLFPQAFVKVFAAGFDRQTAEMAAGFIRVSAVSLYFMVTVSIFGGYLHANNDFLVPASISFPRNIIIVISIVAAARLGIWLLGVGVLLAYVAEFALLLPFSLKKGYRVRPCLDLRDEHIRETLYVVLPILLGVGVSQINKIVDKSIASTLQEGGISALSYASVLNNAVQEVLVTGIITVLFSQCSALAAKGEHGKVRDLLTQTIQNIFFVLIPATVGIICLAEPIVTAFLCRGSFNGESVALTTTALRGYTVGLVFLAVRDTLVKVFYAYKETRITTATSIAAICVNIVFNFVLSRFMGVGGLALATSISAIFQCVVLYVIFGNRRMKLPGNEMLMGILSSLLLSLGMAVVVFAAYRYWLPNTMSVALKLCVSVVIGIVTYAAGNLLLNRRRTMKVVRSILK